MGFSGELKDICKTYGEVKANQGARLSIASGTIHALIGENGAGKSTAMKILYGAVAPDSGKILFDGKEMGTSWNPQAAFEHGIGMVYQHFMLAPNETVHDNLVLGVETAHFGIRNRKKERRALEELMRETGLPVPLGSKAGDLPISMQSRCEILKVLYRKARFLIFDEPTSVLTPQEIEDFLATLKHLKSQGRTILIVTHKLNEVMAVADEITVMRAGSTVARLNASETSVEHLSELMVGRKLHLPKVSAALANSESLAEIRVPQFALELKSGTITGIAGVEGNGQEKLIAALSEPGTAPGLKLKLFGSDCSTLSACDMRKLPIAVIPADRHREGLVLPFPLFENLRLGRKQADKKGYAYFPSATREEIDALKSFDVRPPNAELSAASLSGGNQQKVIIARELANLPVKSVILAVHPTRGVDLGAIEFIHGELLKAAARGAAVLLISSELEELMSLSHRIGVFYQGAISAWFEGPGYDEKAIGLAMLGGAEAKEARA